MTSVSATFEIWVTLALIVAAVVAYASERVSIELTSAGIVAILLVFFHLFPLPATGAANQLGAERVLAGFANPALIAVVIRTARWR
jgi:hypothetical protein